MQSCRRALVALGMLFFCSIAPLLAAEPLAPEHPAIRDFVVDGLLDGQTEGVRVVASPYRIDVGDEVAFRWSGGEVDLPPGTAWFALADETPGVMGFHPVTHVFLDAELRLIEARPATFYPRIYYGGRRKGLTTLVSFRAERGGPPPYRKPVGSARPTDSRASFSYNEFYAVIIEGDVPAGSSYSEFWSDPVRMFRLLLEYGYQEDHIHVLYGEGEDETDFECDYYREEMVDYAAYQQDVRNIFTWMKEGNAIEGIDQVGPDDFIFLFTFDHGSGNSSCQSNLCMMDGCMPDTEFASYFNAIPYKHRAVDMQQCNSGGFIDNLENATTVISTAANCSESAYEADEWDDCGDGVSVNYGEWNYWWMNAMEGHKPWPGFDPVDADANFDGVVSFQEAHNYALANDNRGEHPQWSDLGGIGDQLSLQTSWDGAHLVHLSHLIDDLAQGNGDGVADAGETIVMPTTLENNGEEDASGITATLSADSPWITVEDDHAAYPDIAAGGGLGESLGDHYRFVSNPDTPDDSAVTLRLDWSANGGAHSGSTQFAERIVRVVLAVQQSTVLDEEAGNGDGVADPGESLQLAVTLRNKGHADAHAVEGTLSTASPYATVTENQASFEDIAGQASGRSLSPHFGITIAPWTPDRTWIDCTLEVDAADGYVFTLPLRFIVGSRGSVLLVEDGDLEDADLLEEAIERLGFAVVRELAAETDPDTWRGYSMLVWSAGANTDSVADAAWRDALETFVAEGGRLLIEGGELGYDHRYNDSFRLNVLHVSGWSAHGGGGIAVADDDHPLSTVPNVLDETILVDPEETARCDAVTPAAEAWTALDWETRRGKASVVGFDDDTLEGNGGQVVSLFAQVASLDPEGSQGQALVDNALEWLAGNDMPYLLYADMTIDDIEFGNGDGVVDPGETLRIPVQLSNRGASTASGVWARASVDRADVLTLVDNMAAWPEIASGARAESLAPHLLARVANDAPCGTPITVTLHIRSDQGFRATRRFAFKVGTGGGQHLTFDFDGEAQMIPNPGVLTTEIEVAGAFRTGDVNCWVDVNHSSVGLIQLFLDDPQGKRVTLHNRDGEGTHLVTTYDSETQPHGPGHMSDYDGDIPVGTWQLHVADGTPDMMMGSLNDWRLIFDTADLCHERVCDMPLPGEVGNTLVMSALGEGDAHLEWEPVSGADAYVVWRSKRADMESAESVGESAGASFDEEGVPRDAALYFYQVRARNACFDQGP